MIVIHLTEMTTYWEEEIRTEQVLSPRVVTRYMGSGIKGLKRAVIRDHSPGVWNHNAWDRDQQYFSWNQGSGINFLRVQGSEFLSLVGSGIKILGKNMGSVT